jgi:PhzF family phenazine biosynthesis protein
MKIYQVDAFTNEIFKGNPAAVCILPNGQTFDEHWMQAVAAEMNLSETAFLQEKVGGDLSLRWFTPETEVNLCGHATLATAHILWSEGFLDKNQIARFNTLSGQLEVTLQDTLMTMNFPVDVVTECKEPVGLEMALACPVLNTYSAGEDLLVEVADETTIAALAPYIQQIATIPVRCVIVTAKGDKVDFVSRVFGPNVGIDEDPVTGSSHCSLAPFWAARLGKTRMKALQLSRRGGSLELELKDGHVKISGQAITVFKGELCEKQDEKQ